MSQTTSGVAQSLLAGDEKKDKTSVFDGFTNQYALSKTLRFELKPLHATRKFLQMDELDKEKLFPKDKEKAKNYQSLKYYLDLLHRKFINGALNKFKQEEIPFEDNYKTFNEKSSKDDVRTEDQEIEENNDLNSLRSLVTKGFGENSFLFGKNVIDILEKTFIHDEELNKYLDSPLINFINTKGEPDTIFHNFKGFTGYLSGYHENRKNLYKDDGKAGRVATRIIDQNLPRFFENLQKYELLLRKHPQLIDNFQAGWGDYFQEREPRILEQFKTFESKNNGWKNIFKPNFYNHCMLQDDIEFYNYLVRKLNKDIDEYKQKLKLDNKTKKALESKNSENHGTESEKKKEKIPSFRELYKQILGKANQTSDFIELSQDVLGQHLRDFIKHSDEKLKLSDEIIVSKFIENEEVDGIYISNKAINTISSRLFLSWDFFGGKILDKQNEGLIESKQRKKIDEFVPISTIREVLLSMNDISASDIFKKEHVSQLDGVDHWKNFLYTWLSEWKQMIEKYDNAKENLEAVILDIPMEQVIPQEQKVIIKQFADANLSIYQMTKYFALLKGIKEVQKDDKHEEFYGLMDLYLFGGELGEEKYEENLIYNYYNAFRNFLTKKSWSEEKMKLNFDCPHLFGGWSKNEEKVKLGVILRSEGLYYLAIAHNKNKSIFSNENIFSENGTFEKMEMMALAWKTLTGKGYKRDFGDKYSSQVFDFKVKQYKDYLSQNQINISDLDNWIEVENKKKNQDNKFPDDRKLLKKIVAFLEKNNNVYSEVNFSEIRKELNLLENAPYTKVIANVQQLIKNQYIDNYPILGVFLNRDFKTRKEFEELKEKYAKEIYLVNFEKRVERKTLEELASVTDPKIYLFQIYNKDFQLDESFGNVEKKKITGKEDIETTLFKLLFHNANLKNKDGVILTLNGGAEVFFRPLSLSKKDQRENRNGKELIAKNRYTESKILFHVPITLNFGKVKRDEKNYKSLLNNSNNIINNILQSGECTKKTKIIGIDRGEKHLAYYTVMDQEEKILDQGTLNRIYPKKKDGTQVELDEKKIVLKVNENKEKRYVLEPTGNKINYVNYLQILECKEKNRLLQRKSWDSIESIKELKKGFISHVVNKLCELFLKYLEQDGVPPMIVFENLNVGFKQGRQKIDRQVYQNLELALAKKFSYLTKKSRDISEQLRPGGVLKAYQFVPEIKNYSSDVEKKSQVGVFLYTDPSYTSTTCPNCGFRKRMNKTVYESVRKTIEKFESHKLIIEYVENAYKFTFVTRQTSKDDAEREIGDIIYSDVSRIYRKPNEDSKGWIADTFGNMTNKFDELIDSYKINKNKEIFQQLKTIQETELWKKFMWYFNLLLQVRNSSSVKYCFSEGDDEVKEEGKDIDFVNCPCCHFHSDNSNTWSVFGNKFSESVRSELKSRGESLFNGDANGSYNIARKGKLMIERIKGHPQLIEEFCSRNKKNKENLRFNEKGKCEIIQGKGKKKVVIDFVPKYPDLYIGNYSWDKFTQK